MSELICPECGVEYGGGMCPFCGAMEAGKMACEHCGGIIDVGSTVCSVCGRQLTDVVEPDMNTIVRNYSMKRGRHSGLNFGADSEPLIKHTTTVTKSVSFRRGNIDDLGSEVVKGQRVCNKWVAFPLCFFLGFFGAHKFYEGKFLMGILYIMTMGFMGVGVILDLVILLFSPVHYVPMRLTVSKSSHIE